jgi:hypothetical protein
MEDPSQERYNPANTTDDQSRQVVPYSPSTPSTPPTGEAPDGTNTCASQPGSRVSFLAAPPRNSLRHPHREPVHPGEHVCVLETDLGDMVSIHSNDPGSRLTRTPRFYPSDTQYSLLEDRRKSGQSLVAVSGETHDIFMPGSMFDLPQDTLVKLGTSTKVRPMFGHSQSRSHDPAPPPPSQSAHLSHLARMLNEEMRRAESTRDSEE